MKAIHALTFALALAALSTFVPQTCRAAEPAAERAALQAAIDGIGKASATDVVLSVTRRARRDGDTDELLRLVGKLRARRGYASARALGELANHHDARVREAALYAIGDVGLRVTSAMQDVRESRTDEIAAVRAASYTALAAVGDATDVPALLDDLASADKDTVRGAFDALRGITGATVRCSEKLWRQWWKDTQADAVSRLQRAWDVLETGADATEVGEARVLVDRMAWLDLGEADKRVAAWIDSSDARLRTDGYRLAAKLRLGNRAEDLKSALRFEADDEARRIGSESAVTLGVAAVATATATPVAQAR